MRILVQKFGGTSVATKEAREAAIEHINSAVRDGYRVVVVVSAMGRRGEPYATDTLLNIFDSEADTDTRDLDILMSCGEAISSVVFASQLRRSGQRVTVLNGAQAGIKTNQKFGNARIIDIDTTRIQSALSEENVVVVMGFQGATENGDITTLGRGGSDTTAAALGVALNAEYVDIFTDVEGIMTADPRIVEDARRLHRVTYAEICNLAYQGAKVIHPRAVEIAMQKGIPIRVRSTRSKDEGTLVTTSVSVLEGTTVHDRLVTGVTQTENITQIRIAGDSKTSRDVFVAMAEHGISVDFISITPDTTIYTVADWDATKALNILERLGLSATTVADCAKVSVVGAGIAGVPGIMAKIAQALYEVGIEVLQTADSHTTIWCLVRKTDMERAVRALHQAFDLGVHA